MDDILALEKQRASACPASNPGPVTYCVAWSEELPSGSQDAVCRVGLRVVLI